MDSLLLFDNVRPVVNGITDLNNVDYLDSTIVLKRIPFLTRQTEGLLLLVCYDSKKVLI